MSKIIKMISKFTSFKAEQIKKIGKYIKEERGKLFEVVIDWFSLKNTKNKWKADPKQHKLPASYRVLTGVSKVGKELSRVYLYSEDTYDFTPNC